MITIHRIAVIARTPREVFAYLADFERDREWRSEVVSVRKLPGPATGVGERYEEVLRFPGFGLRSDLEVTEYEPGRLLVAEGESLDMVALQRYELAVEGDGTRLEVTIRIKTGGGLRIGDALAGRLLQRRATENLRRLKRLLESGAAC